MRCDQVREGISALLDGEDPGIEPAALDQHLQSCPGCRRWQHDAARITRIARIRSTEHAAAPDLASRIVPPSPRIPGLRPLLRVSLLLVALLQLTIGIIGLLPPLAGHTTDTHPGLGGMHLPGMAGHLGNEAAAFNIAIGIALAWIAAHPHRARGPLPLLLAFVIILTGLEALDLAAGRIGWQRLALHLPVIAGLGLAAALTRLRPPTMPTPDTTAATTEGYADATPDVAQQPMGAESGGPETGHHPPAARRDTA